MKKIGLFGGTFNPFHNGHFAIAQAFADEVGLDMVVLLPAGNPYHKEDPTGVSAQHRLEMTALAAEADERFAVSDCDIVREGKTYTFDTVQVFRQQFPSAELWWLMGMDSLLQLHTWHKWQTLVKQVNIAVAARQDSHLSQAPQALHAWLGNALQDGSLKLLQTPMYNISSTEIREAVCTGRDTGGVLDRKVEQYIRQHHLYR
ncbi:nicotinate (nicotinamide) nucleotide adenylyltransferase [Neisseria weaveri]|uniref:Probable nicotinate-nucleotide adenylyltransferase n=1 Tax=Neisseria weaveri TaxID=28091 RepID=A0A3S5F9Q2_9NEIS|nr:nicotinate (nicotinamide) nucleotide adenylyltransferase [Neisseria weaveri]EGV38274.1 nicotinate-nucleotide adenylyltransferase [Neisseria weaveri LMG 5135]VEJ50937.1 nicotinate-nucleotide adenylyltransferase [Neisseria weaveri]